jgi:hypothetical protein
MLGDEVTELQTAPYRVKSGVTSPIYRTPGNSPAIDRRASMSLRSLFLLPVRPSTIKGEEQRNDCEISVKLIHMGYLFVGGES